MSGQPEPRGESTTMINTLNRRTMLLTAGATFAALGTGPAFAQAALPPAPSAADWAKLPDLYYVCLSPSGDHFAFIHEDKGDKFMRVVTVADGKVADFNLGKASITALLFADDTHVVVTSEGFDKAGATKHRHSIGSIYDVANKSVKVLFANVIDFGGELAGDVSLATYKGKHVVVASAFKVTDDGFHHLYRFELNGNATVLDQAPENTLDWVLGPDGAPLARHSYIERTRQWTLEYRQGGAWKTIGGGKYEYDLPAFEGLAADGVSILISKRDDAGELGYYQVSADGTWSQPLALPADQTTLLFDPVTRRMNGHSVDGDWVKYNFDDPLMADMAQKAQGAVADYRMKIAARAEDPHRLIVYSEGGDDAGTYYYIDFAKGQSLAIGVAYPQVAPQWLSEKKAIRYKAADGLEIEAYLTLPPNREAKALPLVVMVHSEWGTETAPDGIEGRASRRSPEGRFGAGTDSDVQAFAAAGYAVLQPNPRGSSGYGGAFRKAGFGEYGRKMLSDMADGVSYLAGQGTIDPKRAAIMGVLGGGYSALASMTFLPGVYACAVDVEGISDVKTFVERKRGFSASDTTYSYRYWQRWLGDMTQVDAISPLKAAEKVQGAILIVHGTEDQMTPPAQSKDMVSALTAAGKSVTFVQQDWDLTESQRTAAATLIMDFIKAHIPV